MHPTTSLHPHHLRGFTLVELMVTLAVLGVLMAIALPSFLPLLERWRVRQMGNALENSLYYARSEAMKRGGNVTMEKLGNTAGACQNANTTQDWGCGWVICIDANNNGTCNATETKLQEVSLSGTANIMRKPSGKSLKFDRYGMTNGANILSFTLSPERTGIKTDSTATLCLAAGGRIRVLSGEIDCKKIP